MSDNTGKRIDLPNCIFCPFRDDDVCVAYLQIIEDNSKKPEFCRYLAVIVRGADTDRLDLAPQCAGLLAISLGLSRLFPNDQELLPRGFVLYDALYAWLQHAKGERHSWNPQRVPAPA